MRRLAVKKAAALCERRAAHQVIPSVIRTKKRNIPSAGVMISSSQSSSCSCSLLCSKTLPSDGRGRLGGRGGIKNHGARIFLGNNFSRLAIEAIRGPDIESGDDPGHEKLREGEEIREVDRSENALLHQRPGITDQRRKSEVIDDENDHRRDDETALGSQQLPESRARRDPLPIDRARFLRGGLFVCWFRSGVRLRARCRSLSRRSRSGRAVISNHPAACAAIKGEMTAGRKQKRLTSARGRMRSVNASRSKGAVLRPLGRDEPPVGDSRARVDL